MIDGIIAALDVDSSVIGSESRTKYLVDNPSPKSRVPLLGECLQKILFREKFCLLKTTSLEAKIRRDSRSRQR